MGDDLSATLTESEEQGFATEPVGSPKAAKPGANPCATAYKSVFYDNDFSYLNDPNYHGHCFGDCWKLMPVDNCGQYGTLDVGGQMRLRYHHEVGMGQDVSGPGMLRFEDTVHDILLSRFRLYGNWKASDETRVYVEGIFAEVTDDNGTYLPRPIDINCGDFLNAFIDCESRRKLDGPRRPAGVALRGRAIDLAARLGEHSPDVRRRQADVRRGRLEGRRLLHPFRARASLRARRSRLRSTVLRRVLDLRRLGKQDARPLLHRLRLQLRRRPDHDRLLARHDRLAAVRHQGDWLYEFEGGEQFGRQSGLQQDQDAGFATGGIGHKYPKHRWTPTVWVYYDYASGNFPGGDFNRFNQLFPLGHKYFGFIDAVQRSNIEVAQRAADHVPHEEVGLPDVVLVLPGQQRERHRPQHRRHAGQSLSRTHFGDELDLLAKYKISPRTNVLFGYSHFWRGDKILAPRDADFFYTQWEMNF